MKKIFGLTLGLLLNTSFAAQFVVEMKNIPSTKQLERLQQISGVTGVEKFTPFSDAYFDRLLLIDFDNKKHDLRQLKQNSLIKNIEQSFNAKMFEIKPHPQSEMFTNDMLFPLQWGVFNQKQMIVKQKLKGGAPNEFLGKKGIDIGWKNSIDSIEKSMQKTPVVAVIDTGVDVEHPELKDQIYKNEKECTSNGQVPIDKTQDRDNNGYASDCYGYNFAATEEQYIPFPLDDKNHGTHVAGIISAKRNNSEGITGVSDKIKILPIKVTGFIDETRNRKNLLLKAPSERIARGILYAVSRKVDVINLSLGWPKSMDTEYMRRAIMVALSQGISIVAAAGNNNTNANIYPCAYQGVICVGSVDANGKVSAFSNYGGEVDILAPGDQILSTIPTSFAPIKMNIQGYDILSGTSQAAPFVSATVALLKAVYPNIDHNEIKGRLYQGAQSKDNHDKSLVGLLNIEKSFKHINETRIVPIFKSRISYEKVPDNSSGGFSERFNISEKSEILFNRRNGQFIFPLYLQNIGQSLEDQKVKVSIFFHSNDIALKANTFYLGKENLIRPLGVRGQIRNKYMDNKIKYTVKISHVSQNADTNEEVVMSEKEYTHEVTIAKKSIVIGADKKIQGGMKFVLNDDLKSINALKGDMHKYLRTIEEKVIKTDYPTYYLKHQPTDPQDDSEDGIRLYFFEKDGHVYQQKNKSYFSSKAIKLLEVTKSDYNYDQKEDLLIKTIVQPEDGQEGYILYSYRDMNLEPLVGKFSDIRYYPKLVNVTSDTVRFVKSTLPNKMNLATPYFINKGALADKDQINDPWSKKDRSVLRRIYRLDIILKDDQVHYEARSFMNLDFIKKVRSSLKKFDDQTIANNDTNVELIQLNHQTNNDYYKGSIKALASYGLGFFRTNFAIDINNEKYSINPSEYVTEKLVGFDHQEVIHIKDNQVDRKESNAYVGFLTSDLLSIVTVDNIKENKLIYRNRLENDKILSFISLFKKEETQYMFMETIDFIMLLTEKDGVQKIAKRKTKKFSFLPGSQMSELYYPVVIKDRKGDFKPAIYVDATQLSNNNVYLNTLIEDKLVAPVDLSLAVPSYCMAKNPYPTRKGNFRYVLLCHYNDEYKIIFEDLVSP